MRRQLPFPWRLLFVLGMMWRQQQNAHAELAVGNIVRRVLHMIREESRAVCFPCYHLFIKSPCLLICPPS